MLNFIVIVFKYLNNFGLHFIFAYYYILGPGKNFLA